jgi:hypothetical protein
MDIQFNNVGLLSFITLIVKESYVCTIRTLRAELHILLSEVCIPVFKQEVLVRIYTDNKPFKYIRYIKAAVKCSN